VASKSGRLGPTLYRLAVNCAAIELVMAWRRCPAGGMSGGAQGGYCPLCLLFV
jgi:hypothetical protein